MTVGPCLIVTISVAALLVVLVSFSTADVGKSLQQAISPHSGYPVWHPPIEDFDPQLYDTAIFFNLISEVLSTYFIFKWVTSSEKKHATYFVLDDTRTATTDKFNYLLGAYCLFTSINAVGGRLTSNTSVGWLGFYVFLVSALCLLLKWPYDAAWFKMQGLCSDFALFAQFVRMYVTTKRHLRDGHSERRPLNNNVDAAETAVELHHPPENSGIVHPYQILFLVVASFFHILGNILINEFFIPFSISYLLFFLTYSITYPTYAYFVYLTYNSPSIHQNKLIYLPDTAGWKVATVTISAITLSLLTMRLAVLTQ
ncbi:5689_t:CDS:2 [Acaulospora colombiana]|uniref:5689_t:CDS:1 n=1 Tax=Acaulospora colombiana TaxID=27376 RepID=A0ACA9LQ54_9GLOM|nr:5689_t:CDS:2 [Acaulospora colombiana]